MNKKIIITGSSSELGKSVANELSKCGYEVFFLKLNIMNHSSCVYATKRLIGKNFFALINIAGVTKFGETLKFSSQEFLDVLNINVVGHHRLIKSLGDNGLLPERIINITSLNGFLPWPKFAMYCASKFAAEGFGLSLRYELAPKVQVTNIAPGAIYRPNAKSDHKGIRERIPFLKHVLPFVTDKSVAEEIVRCLRKEFMPARVIVGIDAQVVYWLQKLLPFWLIDRLILWLR